MPRIARIKSDEAIYHVMCHSISEVNLFRQDADKERYLDLLKRYCQLNHCSVLAYCLMSNHLHIHLDPQGYDLSKFMHDLNLSYAVYYNNKYDRKGSLFRERFKSKIIASDRYNLAVSAYIHNNAKDLAEYSGKEYEYPYSSLGIYLGLRKDARNLVEADFILEQFNANDKQKAAKLYGDFVINQKSEVKEGEGIGICLARFAVNEYRNERKVILRDRRPEQIINIVADKLGITLREGLHLKSIKVFEGFRTFSAFILRSLGGLGYKEICGYLGNISLSGASSLCRKGYMLLDKGGLYRDIFYYLITKPSAA